MKAICISLFLGVLTCLFFAPSAEAQTGGNRWALIVGIADYKRTEFSLLGPANDTVAMKRTLLQRGFPEDHIRVYRDRDATRQGILQGWDWLRDNARPGDLVVFYYSGHGTVIPPGPSDTNRDLRSALVPYDTVTASGLLAGSDIGTRIDRLSTDQVVVIVDACHSGRASRLPGVRSRFISPARLGLPPEATPKERQTRQWILSDFTGAPETRESSNISGNVNPQRFKDRQREIYLGASRVDQTASEDTFLPTKGDSRTNPNMGAFTYYLLEEVERDRKSQLTYPELMERVRADLLRRYGREQVREDGTRQPTQEPQLSGTIPTGTGFLQTKPIVGNSPNPPLVASVPPPIPAPQELTLAAVRAPLRVAVATNIPTANRAMLQKLPNVALVTVGEPNDVVVESGSGGAKVWRARVPLDICPWSNVPALLSRLYAAQMLERLRPLFLSGGAVKEGSLRVRANNQTAYVETAIGDPVTLAVDAARDGFVTLMVAGADGTLTGVSDIPITAGKTLDFPATAKGPRGIDYVQVLLTGKRLGLALPGSPSDTRAQKPQVLVDTLARKLFADTPSGSVDTLLLRIRK